MNRDRWQRVQELFEAAIDRPVAERGAFLRDAASGDDGLVDEVRSLLSAHDQTGMVDRLAAEVIEPLTGGASTALAMTGSTVGQYDIVERLGGGGMGVVYRALDRRLDRPVALKFLLPLLSSDPQAERRFVLEAQAAAALEHPNVCTVHEIGQTPDGQLFIVMPLYDGESLQAKIQHGPLGGGEVVDYAIQTCRGLAKAHERGIVHRDIKPANVLVTDDGIVKILDFGIAKLAGQATTGGKVIGTVSYMSPEQTSGQRVDHRSDLWSLGVIIYEMLTGRLPFPGDSVGSVIHAILNEPILPVTNFCPDIPEGLAEVVSGALAKRVEDRPPTAAVLMAGLEAVAQPGGFRAAPSSSARLLPEGERRPATVLVTLVTGYDTMVEQLPAADVDQVIERIHATARQVVSEHGGVVNEGGAEQVVSLFGVPTAHEDDALRAARAGLALHAAVAEQLKELDHSAPLGLQSGIDSGRVVAQTHPTGEQRYRIVGDTVLVAFRLASEAGTGEILASGETSRSLTPFFETEPRPPVTLKGDATTTPSLILRDSGRRDRLETLSPAHLTTYAGRTTELALLESRLALALDGNGQFVSVIGEAGLGKSRLLYEFSNTLAGYDVTVLRGRCQSYGNATVYLPFLAMLRETLGLSSGQPDPADLRAAHRHLSELAEGLEEFLPIYLHLLSIPSDDFPVPVQLQAEALRVAIREAFAAILTMRAAEQPVVVLLEDWHWVDRASADVLDHLVSLASSHPMLIVVASRPEGRVAGGSANQAHHTSIQLLPLEATATETMIESVLGGVRVPDELTQLVYQRTGGNPFFIEEIVQSLVEGQEITVDGMEMIWRAGVAELELPDTVQGVIRSRLDRMDPHSREVLCYASVIGREFDLDILAELRGEDRGLPAALGRLKEMGVIQQTKILPAVEYRFKHTLTQEVTYESLLQHQRRDLHGRVGTAIERMRAERLEQHYHRLAGHFANAEEWSHAVEYGLRSAERAWELSEFPESLKIVEEVERWFDRAPEAQGLEDHRVQLLLRKERLCEVLGLRRRQLEIIGPLIELLERSNDRAQLAEAHLRLGDIQIVIHDFPAAEKSLATSLSIASALGDDEHERKTLRSLGMLRWHQGRYEESVSIIEDVLAADRLRDDQDAISVDITNLTTVLRGLGEHERCRKILLDELEAHQHGGGRSRRHYLLQIMGHTERALGNLEKALWYTEESTRVAEEEGLVLPLGYHLLTQANLHWQLGYTDKALETWTSAVEQLRALRHGDGLSQALKTLSDVLIGLNRAEEARPYLEEAVELFRQLEDYEGTAGIWNRLGRVHERAGSYSEAMAAWGKGRTLCQEHRLPALELSIVEGMARFTRAEVPEPSLALQYYREALALAERTGCGDREGTVRNTIAIIEWQRGQYDEALAQYERALECLREAGQTEKIGLILNSIGVTLHRSGRLQEAIARLEAAVHHNRNARAQQLEGHALAALGDVYIDDGRVNDAITAFTRSLEIRREISDELGEGWMLHRLANAHDRMGALDRKRDCATAAWRIADARNDQELIDALRRL